MDNLKVLSLFSGVGGFDMGLESAGWETIFQCEIDKHCQTVLSKHWPDVPKWLDVSTLTGKHVLETAGPPDVVAWGSPCQDLSVAGKRAGLDGAKSGLFHEGMRIINEIRKETNNEYPRISIWENVPGALSSNSGADFGVVLDEMAKAGALVVEWAVLDAQYFGVPQRRRRIFLVALFHPGDAERSGFKIFPVAESLPGHLAARAKKRKNAASNASGSTNKGSGVVGTLTVADLTKGQCSHESIEKGFIQAVGQIPFTKSRHAKDKDDFETWVEGDTSPTLNTFENHQDTRATVAIVTGDPLIIDGTRNDDVRVYEDGVMPTLTHRMGTGGNNTPMIFDERDAPVVLDRAAYNQGPNARWDSFIEHSEQTTALIARGPHAVMDVRPRTTDAVMGTLQAGDWRGVNNQYVVENKLIIEHIGDPIIFEPGAMSRMKSHYYSDVLAPTLRADMGDNQPAVVQPSVYPIQDGRDIEKHQNGLGLGEDGDPSYTLDTTGGQGIVCEGDASVIGFSHTQGLDAQPSDVHWPTLRRNGGGHAVAIPIDTRNALRDPDKHDAQNRQGLGIGNDGDPSSTITGAFTPAVAIGIQGNMIGRADENGPQGKGYTDPNDPMFTLTSTDVHAVAYDESLIFQPGTMIRQGGGTWDDSAPTLRAESKSGDNEPHVLQYDGYNQKLEGDGSHRSLRVGRDASDFISQGQEMVVRRLTPRECERLMGWEEEHTKFRADGTIVPDTQRYKMCGNGVASPCATWVAKQIEFAISDNIQPGAQS